MDFKGQTALVVGASRGFGRGVTESLVAKGMTVTAVARTREDLEDLARKTLARIIVADATDEQAIERILSEAKPNLLVLLQNLGGRHKTHISLGPSSAASRSMAATCRCIWQRRSTFWFAAQRWLRGSKEDERLYCRVRCGRCISRQALDHVPLLDSPHESAH